MGVDTYIVIPARNPAKARAVLDPEQSDTTTVGSDYLVLYVSDRFSEVEEEAERYGTELAASMPPSMRKALDGRGIAAYPEVGQAFGDASYEELLANHGAPLWLPTLRSRRKARSIRVLLVPVSANREKLLLAHPDLVKKLVAEHTKTAITGSLEIEHWVELQRTLFDAAMMGHRDDDVVVEAVAPRGGLPLYEDKTVDSAKFVNAAKVAATASWLDALPDDVSSAVRLLPSRSRRAREFPGSLGAAPADDDPRTSIQPSRADATAPPCSVIGADLRRLTAFYDDLRAADSGVLCIRFRRTESSPASRARRSSDGSRE